MMQFILFGGNSLANSLWLEEMKTALEQEFGEVLAHRYRHWETGESLIDLDGELASFLEEFRSAGPYVMVAKSVGALLALKGIFESKLNPVACVFVGTSVTWGREKGFEVDKWLKNYSTLTLFIHKSKDPITSIEFLKAALTEARAKNYRFHIMPGNDHNYFEYRELVLVIKSFLKEENLL
jgi:hypothetical protein